MTPDQEQHLKNLKDVFSNLVDAKYRKGQIEHGADGSSLYDRSLMFLLLEARNECIDQFTYIQTAIEKLQAIEEAQARVIPDED